MMAPVPRLPSAGVDVEPSLEAVSLGGIDAEVDAAARAAGVLVAFTGRRGGVSRRPFDSLNLALRVGDDPEAVGENRRRAAAALGFDDGRLVLARQVHGAEVLAVGRHDAGVRGEGDGLVTAHRRPVLGLLTADCAPVVLLGRRGIAVAHAGWRGLEAGVVARTAAALGPLRAAWVGPAIRACCYEVGSEVVDAFRRAGLPVADPAHVDVAEAARAAALAAGAPRVAASPSCTACDGRWFSHRREGRTGRNGTFAALV